jgi:hypothetical protein
LASGPEAAAVSLLAVSTFATTSVELTRPAPAPAAANWRTRAVALAADVLPSSVVPTRASRRDPALATPEDVARLRAAGPLGSPGAPRISIHTRRSRPSRRDGHQRWSGRQIASATRRLPDSPISRIHDIAVSSLSDKLLNLEISHPDDSSACLLTATQIYG